MVTGKTKQMITLKNRWLPGYAEYDTPQGKLLFKFHGNPLHGLTTSSRMRQPYGSMSVSSPSIGPGMGLLWQRIAVLGDSASLVQVIGTDNQSGIRS